MASRCGPLRFVCSASLAACSSLIIGSNPIRAQSSLDDSAAVSALLRQSTEQFARRFPDSALTTLRAIVGRSNAAHDDSARVASVGLPEANSLFQQANKDSTFGNLSRAIALAVFVDSIQPSSVSRFLIAAGYIERSKKWMKLAIETHQCGPLYAGLEDEALAFH